MLVPHDSSSIEDAVLNLILNAREAVKNKANGEIKVRLSTHDPKTATAEVWIEVSTTVAEFRLKTRTNFYSFTQQTKAAQVWG